MRFLRKSRGREPVFRGQITALMALVFVLMLSLVSALFESASIHIQKNNLRARTMIAVESAFAEYDKGLLEKYDIFARYGKEEDSFSERLLYFGASGAEHSLESIQLLSDSSGMPFYEQAVKYAKTWTGLEEFSFGEEYVLEDGKTMENKENAAYKNLENLLQREQVNLPAENNPLSAIQRLKAMDLLTLLFVDSSELSSRSIRTENLPSKRSLEGGNYKETTSNHLVDTAFFVSYLTGHFSNKQNADSGQKLLYEMEYLLEGNGSDRENLTAVCNQLMLIRMLANYSYLLTDTAKQKEVEVVVGVLCTLISVPEITEAVKQAVLFAWAYGESVVDVRGLLEGKKVPLVKSSGTWKLQLNQLGNLATSGIIGGETSLEKGMGYEDYLIGFLLLEKRETLCMRCLDLIETNLNLRVDCCMTKVQVESNATLRRGIKETFTTRFGYR